MSAVTGYKHECHRAKLLQRKCECVCFLERGGVSSLPSAPVAPGRAGPTAPAGLLPLLQRVPILPSVLSTGLWEVPATEAVYSGVHPCLERAQRGDGGGEEVHSEVCLPANPSLPACEPAVLQPRVPGEQPLVFRGWKRLFFCEDLLEPPDHLWSQALTVWH